MPADPFHEPVPGLSDAIVLLRRWRADDAASVHEACQDPEISRWIPGIPVPYGLEDARGFIAAIGGEAWDAGVQASFAIVDPVSDRVLGSMGLHAHQPRRWEIGYWVAPWARRRGVATHALRLLSRWGIREHGLARLGLTTLAGNEASGRTAVAAGFHMEGVLRNAVDDRGSARDLVMYSLIPEDVADRG